ncbi:MAG: hypothetical protein KatS3mg111_0589 [Pirellulaceae bacterium]|nr:MAG: hypothetical protein KatS3mg111_0589 [Pirellulaceae bacterium]
MRTNAPINRRDRIKTTVPEGINRANSRRVAENPGRGSTHVAPFGAEGWCAPSVHGLTPMATTWRPFGTTCETRTTPGSREAAA